MEKAKKRKRPMATRGGEDVGRRSDDARWLSTELLDALGHTDDSNRLVSTAQRRKRKKQHIPRSHRPTNATDQRRLQVLTRKETERETQTAIEKLQKHALTSDQWHRLQKQCLDSRRKKRRDPLPSSVSSDGSQSEEEPKTAHIPLASIRQLVVPTETTADVQIEETCTEERSDESDDEMRELPATEGPHRLVAVTRKPEIEAVRSELPIIGYEQEIVEAITQNDIVIVCGRTGCGKTTQVPQFLYEAGYGCNAFAERRGWIGVTQPRRIAATSTAARVAKELDTALGDVVGYQIRHENLTSPQSTAIKFMTDGIMIRELQQDFLLRSYSVILIDEAHERSLNTDLILGMLSRVVKLRRRQLTNTAPLKVVIMSATLEASAFLSNPRLFAPPPPVLDIPTRQFSVTVHFSKKTPKDDELEQVALNKICRIHRQLPPGTVLVFLTGKREIDRFCTKLRKRLTSRISSQTHGMESSDDGSSEEDVEIIPGDLADEGKMRAEGWVEDVVVLPLYAMLPASEQSRVFAPVSEKCRLIVVSTNVAETSLTIPGVRYVVDTGRAKKKTLIPSTGISRFEVDWISKASAIQRAGRAGRTLPGHCYRLYSSAHFGQNFDDYERPEIQRVSLEDVVLLMKAMDIDNVSHFPFPTPPAPTSLESAGEALKALGALDHTGKITQIGRELVDFPIGARHARMVLRAKQIEEEDRIEGLALFSLSLAAVMSLESPFLYENSTVERKSVKRAHRLFRYSKSDPLTTLNALCLYKAHSQPNVFCQEHFLHHKIMSEMTALERQLRQTFLRTLHSDCREVVEAVLPPPPEKIAEHLRRCIAAGWCDLIARRDGELSIHKKPKHASYVSQKKSQGVLSIHPLSVLSKIAPQYVVYTSAIQTEDTIYMNYVTQIEPEWLYEASPNLCIVRPSSITAPCPFYDPRRDAVYCWKTILYGTHQWELTLQQVMTNDSDIGSIAFAAGILSGAVFPEGLIPEGSNLVMPAAFVNSPNGKFHKNLGLLIQKLHSHGIFTKRALISKLRSNRRYLFPEIRSWITPLAWPRFEKRWSVTIDKMLSKEQRIL